MPDSGDQLDQPTTEASLSMGAICRLLGLKPELIRAWERRYGAVKPVRSSGGTRRYRSSDLERLSQLKTLVDQGHRISAIASLDEAQLKRLVDTLPGRKSIALEPMIQSIRLLDSNDLDRQLRQHFAMLEELLVLLAVLQRIVPPDFQLTAHVLRGNQANFSIRGGRRFLGPLLTLAV